MPRLTAKGREYCKMGHQLELPFAHKLLQHAKEGLTLFIVEDIYCVGLVGKCSMMHAKASCDFIAIVVIDGEKKLVVVECKARATPSTQQQERAHTDVLSRFQVAAAGTSTRSASATSTSSRFFTVIEASASNFHMYVDSSHEAVQCYCIKLMCAVLSMSYSWLVTIRET